MTEGITSLRPFLFLLTILGLFIATVSYEVYACSCIETTLSEKYEKSTHVFVAKIQGVNPVKGSDNTVRVVFTVEEKFKGEPDKVKIVVSTSDDGHGCHVGLSINEYWHVLIFAGESGHQWGLNSLCGWSRTIVYDDNDQTILELRALASGKSVPLYSSPSKCTSKLAGNGRRSKGICFDKISKTLRGPTMVVVPSSGDFQSPFAIGRYEISVKDWGKYCALSGNCKPITNRERFNEPMTNITLTQAEEYAKWLSERTGKTYRLPTAAEWEYAATANGKQPKKDFNCHIVDDEKVIKGNGIVRVSFGPLNGWGLMNYVGNVQEWVVTDSGEVMVVGGNFNTPMEECNLHYMKAHNGSADSYTGFRILMEME